MGNNSHSWRVIAHCCDQIEEFNRYFNDSSSQQSRGMQLGEPEISCGSWPEVKTHGKAGDDLRRTSNVIVPKLCFNKQ